MKKANIVIGLGFGDEGKGITTDFLASQYPNAIVIRFSGGPQAAHTVMIDDQKHIHASYGSGALRGLPSYFSEHCLIHPSFIYNERQELLKKGGNDTLFIHPFAKVITPFDVYANQTDTKNLEDGSCGKGIGATMKRNETAYKLFAIDLIGPKSMLIEKLKAIAHYYRISEIEESLQVMINHFLDSVEILDWKIEDYKFLEDFQDFIFEGSQGILLDMDHGVFPNVTYANTTSKNAYEICQKLGIMTIEVFYVTRAYATRHGSGWMSNEEALILQNNEEETCIYNEFQKEFRIGELDYELLNYALKLDTAYTHTTYTNLVVTCLDQYDKDFKWDQLNMSFAKKYGSYSPKSKDFKLIF